ncbi:MAG: ABC transporter substrate-binding protein [Acetobacteraceae bacterium]|nr:ABC transporter substrate-binding protein [Acetobacteraceae bacterium]
MRRRALLGGTLGTAAALAAGSARADKAQDTLRVTWRDAIPDIDFYYNALRTGLVVSHHVWDTLIYRDPASFQLKPQLASTWRAVDDRTIEFELRPNVTFHDGSKFSADDVVYTVDLVRNDAKLAVPSNYGFIDSARKINDLRVQIVLSRVFPAALEYMSMVLPIYPKAYRERVGAAFSQRPVGTGPYQVTKVDGTSSIELERNDTYFDGPKGKPAIRFLVINEVGEPSDELAALLEGRADWIWNISTDQLPKVAAMPSLQVLTSESMRVGYLNMDAAGRTGPDSPFLSQKVREAVAHAIDRPAMARQFMPGGSRVLDAPCYPTQFGCDAAVATRWDYDPAKAKALLAEAGFSEGFATEIVSYLLPQMVQAVQGYLAAVGIRATVSQPQIDLVVRRSAEGLNPIEMGSWGSYSINDVSAFLPYFFDGGAHDYARDAEVTKLIAEAGAITDLDRRRADYSAAIRRITAEAYYLPLFSFVTNYAMSRTLNFRPSHDELPRFYLASWR